MSILFKISCTVVSKSNILTTVSADTRRSRVQRKLNLILMSLGYILMIAQVSVRDSASA